MLCKFLLYSKVTQAYMYIHSLSRIIFHHVLSQETRYSFLRCTAGPHGLSILNTIVGGQYIFEQRNFQTQPLRSSARLTAQELLPLIMLLMSPIAMTSLC